MARQLIRAKVSTLRREEGVVLAFSGTLDGEAASSLWRGVMATASRKLGTLAFDLTALDGCDTAGAVLLVQASEAHNGPVEEIGASPAVLAALARVRNVPPEAAVPPEPASTWHAVIVESLSGVVSGVAFMGEALVALVRVPLHPRMLRLADVLRVADQAGFRALPLTLMVGLLMGLILAFQSLIPMRRFGAEIYVANLVAISMIRELGPLLAAVILAGRTGSAFAAEIGTMKVNQEIDALTTMGIDPMTLLVLPRLLAIMLVIPAMTVVLELAGLLGMTLVMVGAGFPLEAIGNQVVNWVKPLDFTGGLFKAVFFGAVVAAIGCRAGLSTGVGPRAVGLSATAAVVGGIVATIILDGVFAVLYFRLWI